MGPFYPKGLDRSGWLQYYAGIIDFVEVDSTFYSIPSPFRVKKWAVNTPAHFKFTAKMPKIITHDKAMFDSLRELEMFYSALAPLKDKVLSIFSCLWEMYVFSPIIIITSGTNYCIE